MFLKKVQDSLLLKCKYEEISFPKSLKGRWNSRFKMWEWGASIMMYQTITSTAKANGILLEIESATSDFFTSKSKSINSFKSTGSFKTKPFPHQKSMTDFILKTKKCFLFSGVGTGKSKSVIDAVTKLHSEGLVKKVLIISPASIMWNFKNEIGIHSDLEATIIYGSINERKKLISRSQTVFDIINYEILDKLKSDICKKQYDMLVFDEIHYCKKWTSIRAKAAYHISKNIPYKVGMSGTIICNHYEDIFSPYKIIDSSIFGTYITKFRERYFVTVNLSGYDQLCGYRNENELKKLIALNSIKFQLRDVVDSLPPETTILKTFDMSIANMKQYKAMKRDMLIEFEGQDITANNVLHKLLRLSQMSSGFIKTEDDTIITNNEKLNVLKDILSEVEDKVVIFCRFTMSIDRIDELCLKLGKKTFVYDGRTRNKNIYLDFEKSDEGVLICQLQKSEGFSVPSAKYCIFYELNYSYKDHIQSKGRILRASGSKHDVIFYIYLLARNTLDEVIYKTIQEKDFNSKNALEFVKGENKNEG